MFSLWYSWNIAHLPFTLNDTRCIEITVKSKLIDIQHIIPVLRLGVMVFNVTFTNISVKSWGSVLLVEVTGVPRENQWPVPSHWQALSHNVVLSAPCLSGIQTLNNDVYLFVRYLVFDDMLFVFTKIACSISIYYLPQNDQMIEQVE